MSKVLNVGGNSKDIPLPAEFDGWEHVLLDIDPAGNPDVVCDARELAGLPAAGYDAVYCSHNLEHYFRHDVARVLAGFIHVLKPEGFAVIRVPDLDELMRAVAKNNLDIDDVLYDSPMGPITVHDVIYGHSGEIRRSDKDYFAHKTGFTKKSLTVALREAGFTLVFNRVGNFEVLAIAFINPPTAEIAKLLQLPADLEDGASQQAILAEALALALKSHQAGRLGDAEALYRHILLIEPGNETAQNNLGLILLDRGDLAAALEHLAAAAQAAPDSADAQHNYGLAKKKSGSHEEALTLYRRALELRPDYAEAHNNLASLLQELGRQDEAMVHYRIALRLRPDWAQGAAPEGEAG